MIVGGFYPGSYYLQYGGVAPTPTVLNCTVQFVPPFTLTFDATAPYSATLGTSVPFALSVAINPDPE